MKGLSRNDSCWCGSGRKYKHCHYNMDMRLQRLEQEGYRIPQRRLIKNATDIMGIKESAKITTGILEALESLLHIGMTTREIDQFVYDYTIQHGGRPATLHFNGYGYSCCTSINNVVCHGIPDETILQDGDIINVDISTEYKGYYSDASRMYLIGQVGERGKKIVAMAKTCLERGISSVEPYQPINVIGQAIEPYAREHGFSVVYTFCGHGIGHEFHEEPTIDHFVTSVKGMIMVPGMVFTIEPMINEGANDTKILPDGWTAVTTDNGLSAQWEHTLLVTEDGVQILT